MIVAAVFLGLVIAYWYLWRAGDNSGRRRKAPQTMPFPQKHPPVDLTPTSSDWLQHRQAPASAVNAPPQQPQPLRGTPDREVDDLKQIAGIGPKLEQLLHANGIFNFGQIADWQEADVQAMDKLLSAFHGRIQREDWVGQARKLHDAKDEKGSVPFA
jgi:NADH-quinone oxidoreductase subunit E